MSEGIHTAPKPFVFVLMPFSQDFDDVYKLAIKPACEKAGAYCERVDEQHFDGSMLQRIYNQISKADFIIADMSGKNANVFYEVGYSHAIDKRVILVTNKADDIPFDLKHHPHIVYGSVSQLLDELGRRARWAVDNPKEVDAYVKRKIEVIVQGIPLADSPVVHLVTASQKTFGFYISVHNATTNGIGSVLFQLALEMPPVFTVQAHFSTEQRGSEYFADTKIYPDSERVLQIIDQPFSLLPDSWLKLHFFAQIKDTLSVVDEEFKFVCKLFTEEGTEVYPFRVIVKMKANTKG